jgi:hypothetical protein
MGHHCVVPRRKTRGERERFRSTNGKSDRPVHVHLSLQEKDHAAAYAARAVAGDRESLRNWCADVASECSRSFDKGNFGASAHYRHRTATGEPDRRNAVSLCEDHCNL